MKNIIKNLLIIGDIKKKFLIFLILWITIVSLFEIISIASIYPLLQFFLGDNFFFNKIEILKNLSDKQKVLILLMSVFLLFLLKNIIILSFNYFLKKNIYLKQWELSNQIYKIYLFNNLKLNSNLSDINTNIGFSHNLGRWTSEVFSIFSEFLFLIFILIFLILTNFRITILIIFIFTCILLFYNFFLKTKLRTWGKRNSANHYNALKKQIEAFSGLRELTVLGKQLFFFSRYSKNTYNFSNTYMKMSVIDTLPKIFLEISFILFFLGAFFILSENSTALKEALPILGIYLIAAFRVIPSISKIVNTINGLNFAKAQIEIIKNLLSHKIISQKDKKIINKFKKIKFNNVEFSFSSAHKNKTLLKSNLELKNNKFYGVIGKSGSGKTTFTNLLLGLINPTKGKITIDKTNIENCRNSWLEFFGLVSQDVFIMNDNLSRNVAFGYSKKDIDYKRVHECLKLAELFEFLKPDGTIKDIMLDENSKNISFGQRQRIGIARALYNNPKILILDEPTSSLDKETGRKFINSLNKLRKNKLIIICTHDYKNLKFCDKIIEISDGLTTEITRRKMTGLTLDTR